jgi:carboxylesterase type B
MEILIDDSKRLEEIQNQFSGFYPYLKLEFFSKPHRDEEASAKREILDRKLTLREARAVHNTGMLVVRPTHKVSDLEHDFQEVFGLPVQVFRKVGKTWIETTTTDHRTLREQNKWAEMLNETGVVKEPLYPSEPAETES